MKKQLTIEIDLTSSTGNPAQLESLMEEICESFTRTVEHENCSSSNRIVYNDWDDPHPCELNITIKQEPLNRD